MSDNLSFVELDGQHLELLPARLVMSLFIADGEPGTPGSGGAGVPGHGHNDNNFIGDHQVEEQGIDGRSGSANPGH